MPHSGTGARGASDLPSWTSYLEQRSGRGRTSRRGGRTSKPQPPSVDRARSSYESAKETAEAYGVEEGPGGGGFLERLSRFIDYPGAAVRSGVRELVDTLDGDPGTEASFEDFRQQLDERQGSGTLFGALQTDEDDGLMEKGAKFAGSFLSDVALDPLSIVSGGGSILGKRAATEVVRNQVMRRASKLGDDLTDWSAKQLSKRAGSDSAAQAVMKQTGETWQQSLKLGDDTAEAVNKGVAATRLGDEAAGHYLEGGSAALRKFLEGFGKQGRAVWDDLPRDLKGGLRIRAHPFSRKAAGVGGGGRFAERLGLDGLVERSHLARNWVRSSMAGRAVADTFGGKWGKDYGSTVSAMVARRSDDLSKVAESPGAVYARYSGIKNASDEVDRVGFELGQSGQNLLSTSEERLAMASDPEDARRWYTRYFSNPQELRKALNTSKGLDESQRAGAEAAAVLRRHLEGEARPLLKAQGIDVGDMGEDYVPRVIASTEKARKRAQSQTARRGGAGYDPTAQRTGAYLEMDPETGEARWLTPEEANELSDRVVFETDPTRIMGSYIAASRQKVMDATFARGMQKAGLVLDEAPKGTDRAYKQIGKEGVRLPKQLEGKWAEAEIADAMHRHFKTVSKPESGFEKFADQVWNPFMTVWKASKTIARGPGYHTRNIMGGMYNNWLAKVPLSSHKRAAKVVSARRKAVRQAKRSLGEDAEITTIADKADGILRQKLSDDLYELHTQGNKAGLVANRRSRELPTRGHMDRLSDQELEETLRTGGKGARYGEEAGPVGRVADKALTSRWVKLGEGMAETSEEYLRLSAFDEGMRRYGNVDDAMKLSNATQFDYADLSRTEQTIRNNWAPFFVWCVPTDHEILTRHGWKTYDRLVLGEEVLVLDPETHETRWEPVQEVRTFDYNGELWSIDRRAGSIEFTPNHRWPYEKATCVVKGKEYGGERGVTEARNLTTQDTIPLAGKPVQGEGTSTLSPRLASILGWVVSDGYFRWREGYPEMLVYQSPKKHLEAVIDLLGTEPRKPHPDTGVVAVPVAAGDAYGLMEAGFKTKGDLPGIVGELSYEAAEAMWQAMFDAEGHESPRDGARAFVQTPGPVMDSFQALTYMTGRSGWVTDRGDGTHVCYVKKSKSLKVATGFGDRQYDGKVWCPVTPTGTWFVRHDGAVMPTGNTKKNVPLQVRSIAHDPGKLNRLMNANEEAKEAFGDPDFDGVIPDWMAERLGWVTPLELGGSPIAIGVESPAIDLNKWVNVDEGPSGAIKHAGNEALNMLAPGPKQAVEKAMGVDTFTGAPHPPGGVRAPLSLRWFPGIPKRTDEDGEVRVPAWIASFVTDMAPFVGELERYVGAFLPDSKYYDRKWSNLHSFAGPLPGQSMTLTEGQQTGEYIRRSLALNDATDWADVTPEERQRIARLTDAGIPEKMAASMVLG